MHQRALTPLAIFASFGLSLFVVTACTTTSDTGSGSDAGSSGTPAPPPASGGDGGTDGGAEVGACSGEASADTCLSCCESSAKVGEGEANAEDIVLADKAYYDCICDASRCQTQCGASMFCAENGAEPTAECETCMGSDAVAPTCEDAYLDVCNDRPGCLAFETCVQSSGCDDKP